MRNFLLVQIKLCSKMLMKNSIMSTKEHKIELLRILKPHLITKKILDDSQSPIQSSKMKI